MPDQKPTGPSRPRRPKRRPRSGDHTAIDFDVLGDLLSFYMRCVGIELNRDLDAEISEVDLAKGTGKVSTLLFVAANPGIRPSVIAHYIFKDRSEMARLLNQMERNGLVSVVASTREGRARELYLTPKGRRLVDQVRDIARRQSDDFFAMLAEDERRQLLTILKKAYAHLLEAEPAR